MFFNVHEPVCVCVSEKIRRNLSCVRVFLLLFFFSSCESVGARKGFIITFEVCVCVCVLGLWVGCQSLPRPA